MTNIRPYSGSYTGDLRSVVHLLEGRLASNVPLYLIGNSLGGNLMTKYLGEEGLSGTLPSCVKGGVSLGSPLDIHSKNNFLAPWTQLSALAIKFAHAAHWKTWRQTTSYPEFRRAHWAIMTATTTDQIDEAMIPLILRNETRYPFATTIGYNNTEEYWKDCSSWRLIQHVSVPLLQVIAGDDPIVYRSFQKKLAHCSLNPYVMSVETKCGGHLGWQESPPSENSHEDVSGFRPTWAGRAAVDFIDAIGHLGPLKSPSTDSSHHVQHEHGPDPFAMADWEKPPQPHQKKKAQPIPVLQSRL